MLCEICKKNNANVHITKIVNGIKQELNVCENCAKNVGEFNPLMDINLASPFTFQNLISGFMDYISQPTDKDISFIPTCKNCGTTYTQFKEKGLVGCSECYKNLNSTLMPIIKRVQGNVSHVGKIPRKAGKDIIQKKKISELREQLKKAIETEEYEKAAEIRDEIKDLEKGN